VYVYNTLIRGLHTGRASRILRLYTFSIANLVLNVMPVEWACL
jgi:hypothetical protein